MNILTFTDVFVSCFILFYFFIIITIITFFDTYCDIELACDWFVFSFTWATSVLCFHMKSFNYGAKGVRDLDPDCRCHQSNIMLNSIFSVKIAQCVNCLFAFFLFCFMCVLRGDILGSFYS